MPTQETYLLADDGAIASCDSKRPKSQRTKWLMLVFACLLLLAITSTFIGLYVHERKKGISPAKAASLGQIGTLCANPDIVVPNASATFHQELRSKVAITLNISDNEIIYMKGAEVHEIGYSDTEAEFQQESNFFYMTGYDRPGEAAELVCRGLTSRGTNTGVPELDCYLFVETPTTFYAVWNGEVPTLEGLRVTYHFANLFWKREFNATVAQIIDDASKLYVLPDVATGDLPTILSEKFTDPDNTVLMDGLTNARSVKTEQELDMLLKASEIGTFAHKYVMLEGSHSHYEYQIETHFVAMNELCAANRQAYLPIVGSGTRSSILHYNTNRKPLENNWILIDAGGSYYGYATDITRTWPLDGKFSDKQKVIYNIVLDAQNAAIPLYVAGGSWGQASAQARYTIVEGLIEAGLAVNGTVDELVAKGIASVFMPHGLGHTVGLDVHDANPTTIFAANMVYTCEPGVYFIAAKFETAFTSDQKYHLNHNLIDEYMAEGMGGVRIEDVLVVQDSGPPNVITDGIPRTVDDIEKWIRQ